MRILQSTIQIPVDFAYKVTEPRLEIIVGALSDQNWHRQIRRLGLDGAARLEYVIRKTLAVAKEFDFTPMALDLDLAALPSNDKSYAEAPTRDRTSRVFLVAVTRVMVQHFGYVVHRTAGLPRA